MIRAILNNGYIDPRKLALTDGRYFYTYRELGERIRGLAGWIQRRTKSGDRVIVQGPNSAAFVIAHLAVIAADRVSVPLPFDTDTLDHYSDPALRIHVDHTPLPWAADYTHEQCDLAAIMYTTGSTDDPKGVKITRKCLDAAISHITQTLPYSPTSVETIGLPLSHSFGLGHVYCTLVAGGCVRLAGLTKPKQFIDSIGESTGMPATPAMLRILMTQWREYFVPRCKLKYMVVNSAALPPDLATDVLETFPDMELWVYYGLTEASRSTFNNISKTGKLESVGYPAPHVSVKVEHGEVVIAGKHLSPGYWKGDDIGEWLYTGDLGEFDKDGYLYLKGRKDDVINTDGAKYRVSELEELYNKSPIEDCAVVSLPHDTLGEVVGLAVVGQPEAVRCWAPHMQIRYVDSIPRSETGKVLRAEVRKLFLPETDNDDL